MALLKILTVPDPVLRTVSKLPILIVEELILTGEASGGCVTAYEILRALDQAGAVADFKRVGTFLERRGWTEYDDGRRRRQGDANIEGRR